MARQKNRYGSEHAVTGEGERVYPLPQSDEATWKAARPDGVKGYLHPDQAEMNEEIGPHQWVGRNPWFGKTFYNSEGATGGLVILRSDQLTGYLVDRSADGRWEIAERNR